MKWVRKEIDKHTAHHRQQQTDGEPKAVEERQAIEDAVRVGEVNNGGTLTDVGKKVGMSELHTLGHTLGTTGEQDGGGVIEG